MEAAILYSHVAINRSWTLTVNCSGIKNSSNARMFQVLRESLPVPGTSVRLVYASSSAPGYMSALALLLTPDTVPRSLVSVRLRVVVEGVLFERDFEAEPSLKYCYAWDRRDAYNQKVYGIVVANG